MTDECGGHKLRIIWGRNTPDCLTTIFWTGVSSTSENLMTINPALKKKKLIWKGEAGEKLTYQKCNARRLMHLWRAQHLGARYLED